MLVATTKVALQYGVCRFLHGEYRLLAEYLLLFKKNCFHNFQEFQGVHSVR